MRGKQLNLFGVEAAAPRPADLAGLLAGPGQVVRMGGTARVSVVVDTLWGFAALPSAGDEAGMAAVDRWAAKHHVTAGWVDGRYKAVMHLGGRLRYGVLYTPERTLRPADLTEPELAVA